MAQRDGEDFVKSEIEVRRELFVVQPQQRGEG